MRVAWLTPLSRRTGIAKYSLCALDALAGVADVEVWTNHQDDNYEPDGIPVHIIESVDDAAGKLDGYDHVVFNTGNNTMFNYDINELCLRKKGVVVIHDRVLHHIQAHKYLEHFGRPETYRGLMKHYYGDKGRQVARHSSRYRMPVWETSAVQKYPLIETVLWNASGVVVHSRDLLDYIAARTPAPARSLYFPFVPASVEGDVPSRSGLKLPQGRVVFLQYGHITSNKNVHKVIEAFAQDADLRRQACFVVVGDNYSVYGDSLKQLVEEKSLGDCVRFTGHVSDRDLHGYIHAADVCINLRFPSSEGASWSLVEQMYFGKPIIATLIGFYAEMPDDCVIKVRPPISISRLTEAMKLLTTDRVKREEMGRRCGEFVRENFAPAAYARNFISFLDEVRQAAPFIDLIDRVSAEVERFSPSPTESCMGGSFGDRLASEISILAGEGSPPGAA